LKQNGFSSETWQKIVLWMIVGIITVVVAGPALAAENGVGVVATGGVGSWLDEQGAVPANDPVTHAPGCGGSITQTTATWSQAGTYTAGAGSATYTGPSDVVMTSSGHYWFDPLGSYAPNTNCTGLLSPDGPILPPASPGTPGYQVPSTQVTVTGALPGTSDTVSCTGSGTFSRTAVTVVQVTATGNCTVKVGGITTGPSTATLNWTLNLTGPPAPTIAGGVYRET